jgi:hypothetical protein
MNSYIPISFPGFARFCQTFPDLANLPKLFSDFQTVWPKPFPQTFFSFQDFFPGLADSCQTPWLTTPFDFIGCILVLFARLCSDLLLRILFSGLTDFPALANF